MNIKKLPEKCMGIYDTAVQSIIYPPSIYLNSKLNVGHNIYSEDWDLLIILDSCRPNSIREISDEYSFLESPSTKLSVGGSTREWLANTFIGKYKNEIERTSYISANPTSKTVLDHQFQKNFRGGKIKKERVKRLKRYGDFDIVDKSHFRDFIEIYNFDNVSDIYSEEMNNQTNKLALKERMVTDLSISIGREQNPEKMILHYLPPHDPFIAEKINTDTEGQNGYKNIKILEDERPKSYEAYLDNLRWGLDEVSIVLENIDKENVIITSDHGRSFSKLGATSMSGSINPSLRRVPWIKTTAEDRGTYEPQFTTQTE